MRGTVTRSDAILTLDFTPSNWARHFTIWAWNG